MLMLSFLAGCALKNGTNTQNINEKKDYVVGIWLSYWEVDRLLSGNLESEYTNVLKNCKRLGVTDVFVHVRPFCDAIYKSEFFPMRKAARGDEDVLKTLIELTHTANIRFHAWINPYRVRTTDSDIENLDEKSPARVWLQDENTENDLNVCLWNGIYLNPSRPQVRRLVIDGVREIIANYDVDGIHFDDYFYPTSEEDFDKASYEEYCSSNEHPLSLAEWRRANVNQLIGATYTAVKFFGKHLIFSVSPTASLQKNKNELFADVEAWTSNTCVDWIIPQLYFGFEYPEKGFCFNELLKEWKTVKRAENVRLLVGLAAYKLDEPDALDADEWQTQSGLLAKQTSICRKDDIVGGHIYYSYSSLFNEKNKKVLETLLWE